MTVRHHPIGNNFLLEKLKKFVHSVHDGMGAMKKVHQLLIHMEIDRLRGGSRYHDPKNLVPFGGKLYSQNDEDGIVQEIFRRIGETNKTFVEFGIGDGLECNTLSLLFNDWRGLWIDASTKSVSNIKKYFSDIINAGNLRIVESFITTDNINEIVSANVQHNEIDLLSVDIDGNDYHILNAITCISPRVIIIEYNAKFSPPTLFCMDYDEYHTWDADDCFGVSLKFLEINLDRKGYHLVGCSLTGVNAFFVRKDLVADKFLQPFSAEYHYEPARYHLSGYSSGHPASYKTLAKSLTMRIKMTDTPG